MRRNLIAVILTLSAGVSTGAADESAGQEAIRSLHPNYQIVLESELDPAMLEYLRRPDSLNGDHSLTSVTADFDGNGLDDHAAIIRAGDKSRGGFVLVLQTANGQFREAHRELFDWVPDYLFLTRVEAGQIVRQTEAIDGPEKSALLQHPAVELNYFEKSSVVFYWDPATEQIDEIWTSD